MKRFQKAIMTLDAAAISALQTHGEIEIEGERFTNEEIEILPTIDSSKPKNPT